MSMRSAKKAAMPHPQKNQESSSSGKLNVQVALRARPLNADEKKANCTNTVKIDGGKKIIHCKAKMYGPFDEVYGPNSTQVNVYEEVVLPQVQRVLAGFNCTVFAYGQTGTGKTFTMEGGRPDAESSEMDETTGMTPRAVETIFNELLSSGAEEYSVRVSYLEMYNEEIYDLLAPNTEDRGRLRLYDDPSKKGAVIVSGAEEVPVRTRNEVYEILRRGADNRSTASTLMNMNSSRSHSIFTVSVVVRENTASGEEMVKTGKLNLVDLAGSENIGRSGAEGKRVKEAGNINQSLLTLGRVITALTSSGPHIPYRESKLTRLLQDSLGGSTITSIIATVSPASSNYEETISTLEYAMRAKSIRNHPECNQKLSRKALLKEYNEEIEKLRRDLRVAREKNGIHLSEESYEGMERDIAEKSELILELNARMDVMIVKLQRFLEDQEFMDEQYRSVYHRSKRLESKLQLRVDELDSTKKDLADTTARLSAHESALRKLHKKAKAAFCQMQDARSVVMEQREQAEYWWKKDDEHRSVARLNRENLGQVVQQASATITSSLDSLDAYMNEVVLKNRGQLDQYMDAATTSFSADVQVIRANHAEVRQQINQYSKTVSDALSVCSSDSMAAMEKGNTEAREIMGELTSLLSSLSDDVTSQLDQTATKFTEMSEQYEEMQKELAAITADDRDAQSTENEERSRVTSAALQASEERRLQMTSFLEKMLALNNEAAEQEKQRILSLVTLDQSAMDRHVARLETTSAVLQSFDDVMGDTVEVVTSSVEMLRQANETIMPSVSSTDQKLTSSRAAVTSCVEAVSSKLFTDVSATLNKLGEAVTSTLNIASAACDRAELTVLDTAQDSKELYEKQEEGASQLVSSVNNCLNSLEAGNKDVVADWQMEVLDIDEVPSREHRHIADEENLSTIPKMERLLDDCGYNQGRLSIARTRESLLDVGNIGSLPMSPDSIALKKKSRMEDIGEENESNRSEQ